jgi:AsmA protein
MRRAGKLFIALIAIIGLGAAAAWALLPTERILRLAADQVRAATGRELTIAGAATPSLWPALGASVEGIALSNADWASDSQMLSAKSARISVALWPLLSGDVQVTGLVLVAPKLSLEIAADGRRNWDFAGAAPVPASGAAPSPESAAAPAPAPAPVPARGGATRAFGIDRATLQSGELRFRDARGGRGGRGGRDIRLTALNAALTMPSPDETLELDGEAMWNGAPAAIAATLSSPATLLAGEKTELRLALSAAGATLDWDGTVALPALGRAMPSSPMPGGPMLRGAMLRGALSATAPAPGPLLVALGLADVAAALPAQARTLTALTGRADIDLGDDALDADITLTVAGAVAGEALDAALDLRARGGVDWARGGPLTLTAALDAGDAGALSLDGVARDASGALFAGTMEASGAPRRLAALAGAGAALAGVPADRLREAALSGALRLTAEGLSLDDGTLAIDDAEGKAHGGADWSGARPAVRAALSFDALDLRPWMAAGPDGGAGKGAGAGARFPSTSGWSRDPIDLSALGALDLDVSLGAGPVRLAQGEIARLTLTAIVEAGAGALTIERAEMFGGVLSGRATARATREAAALTGEVSVSGMKLGPLLAAFEITERLEGTADFSASGEATGASVDALMRALSGKGRAEARDGAIIGIDLASAVRALIGGGAGGEAPRTDFTALSASWTIAKGVLRNDDLRLAGPLLRVEGAGDVDLGARTLAYRVTPKAVATIKGQGGAQDLAGLAVPFNVRGPWASPAITPDLAAAARGLLTAPRDAAGGAQDLLRQGLDALRGAAGGAGGAAPAPASPTSPADALRGLFDAIK